MKTKIHVKLRDKWTGVHVRRTVFTGPDRDHLALSGTLNFSPGEYVMLDAVFRLHDGAASWWARAFVSVEAPNRREMIIKILEFYEEMKNPDPTLERAELKKLCRGALKI